MVEAVTIDPLKPSVLMHSQTELDEIQAMIDAGALPPDYLDRCDKARKDNTFGVDHKVDSKGNAIEQGRGSAGNQTRQSIEAYKKWCSQEIGFERTLSRMEKEFAESEARRKAEAAASKKKPGLFR